LDEAIRETPEMGDSEMVLNTMPVAYDDAGWCDYLELLSRKCREVIELVAPVTSDIALDIALRLFGSGGRYSASVLQGLQYAAELA
jgi:hypothetical protein